MSAMGTPEPVLGPAKADFSELQKHLADYAFAIRPDDAFEAEPQCPHGSSPWAEGPRVAGERQFDGIAGQPLAFPGEQ